MREAALKVLNMTNAKNEQIAKETQVNVADAIGGLLPDKVSDSDISAAVSSGRITASEADAYYARNVAKDAAFTALGTAALTSYANNYLADKSVRSTRRKAEVLEADVVAERLSQALAARAGAKRHELPVTLSSGLSADHDHEARLLTTIVSASSEPLTQLTVLMAIRTAGGDRYAVAYIPRLEPGRGVQVAPAYFDFAF
ncbi:MAG: hypothetical protein JF612_14000, partial [Planctomycetia bacterium]|nr:hypothetical protein [Planctomycetia bacterium]